MYNFVYNLNDKDYLEFNTYHFNSTPSYQKRLLVTKLFVPVVFAVLLVYFYVRDRYLFPVLVSGFVYAALSVVWFFAVKPLTIMGLKMRINSLKKDGKLPYDKNIRLKFDDMSICETSEKGEARLFYSVIERIVEDNHAFYIYHSAIEAFIIPFSVFDNIEQKNGFFEFINAKCLIARDTEV